MSEQLRVAELLAGHATIKIATTGGPVSPWVATAYFADDRVFELLVMIEASGKTLANIRADPRVAVMLENGDPMTLFAQGEGKARVVESERDRIRRAVVGKTPSSSGLMNIPTLVPVVIAIERWLLTDVPRGWFPAHELRRTPKQLAASTKALRA